MLLSQMPCWPSASHPRTPSSTHGRPSFRSAAEIGSWKRRRRTAGIREMEEYEKWRRKKMEALLMLISLIWIKVCK